MFSFFKKLFPPTSKAGCPAPVLVPERWYLLAPGNQPHGPFDVGQLRAAVARMPSGINTLIAREGAQTWIPFGKCFPVAPVPVRKPPPPATGNLVISSTASAPQPALSISFSVGESSSSRWHSTLPKIKALEATVRHRGKADAPLLRKEYATPMPSADFSPFLADCLATGDLKAAVELVALLHDGSEMISMTLAKGVLKDFVTFPFGTWLSPLPRMLPEIIAVMILSGRGDSASNKKGLMGMMTADALFVHVPDFHWRPEILEKLRARTNRYIGKDYPRDIYPDRSEVPYIKNVQELSPVQPLNGNRIFDWLLTVSPAVRSYFFYSDYRKTITTDYGLRCFGVDDERDGRLIIASGFFAVEDEVTACLRMLTKEDFLKLGEAHGVALRKSWKKDAMFAAIREHTTAGQAALAQTPPYRRIERHPDYAKEWAEVLDFKARAAPHCRALVHL